MAVPVKAPAREKLFDVTQVIGSVYGGGDEDPRVQGFRLVVAHCDREGVGGTYVFPDSHGDMISVTYSSGE